MIINSGFRGASRIRKPANMRGFHIHGFGAALGFGEDIPTTGYYDQPLGPTQQSDSTSSSNTGTVAVGIGNSIAQIAGSIAQIYSTSQRPSTNQYGAPPQSYPQSDGFSISPTMLAGFGVLALGAILLINKK